MNDNIMDGTPVAKATTVTPSQPISFCWWALSRIVMLLQFDSRGVYHSPEVCKYYDCLCLHICLFIATV